MIRSQTIAPISPAKITQKVTTLQIDQARADRLGDGRAERERRDEIEEGRPDDRLARAEHPRRDDRRDRVGRVVEAVDVVEDQRDADQGDDRQQIGVHPIRRA